MCRSHVKEERHHNKTQTLNSISICLGFVFFKNSLFLLFFSFFSLFFDDLFSSCDSLIDTTIASKKREAFGGVCLFVETTTTPSTRVLPNNEREREREISSSVFLSSSSSVCFFFLCARAIYAIRFRKRLYYVSLQRFSIRYLQLRRDDGVLF